GNHLFEMDKDLNIRPYGDKPTLEQYTMAKSLEALRSWDLGWGLKRSTDSATYIPLTGSNLYHGVFRVDPQKWLSNLLNLHQPPYTPDDVQPHPTIPEA